ncbi:metallophosphoesterase family protein [Symmachiella dynata]|uniref:metallophosphoesterase family protein n=1 Tax=Symmachiella dynata TaxID=2527995 RepID=UPI0011A00F79|nr:metallophosphoesterase family protein [Symmachiella dynata]
MAKTETNESGSCAVHFAVFGGIYNNYLALQAAIEDAKRAGAEALYCLGDMGAFGPYPDRVFAPLRNNSVICIQGNYDNSIGNDLQDCQCGYTDPRDNYFAKLSYDYTYANTSAENRRWLRDLPSEHRIEVDGLRILMCHGSPRKTNEFLWESTTSTQFLDKLADDYQADLILATHTGIHWQRELTGGRRFVNVGVLGRPENDGRTVVWYAQIRTGSDAVAGGIDIQFVPLEYDHLRLAQEMRDERLPQEFVSTIQTGWWTTCLEVLPSKERRRGPF